MAYTFQLESPDSYHKWTALSTVAACLGRKVWIQLGYFPVFPNMYVVLVGPAGRCRKGVAINSGTDLILGMKDVKISADAITREALIRMIKLSEVDGEIDGKPYRHASVTVVSKELAVFLGTGNHDLISLLTDLYDCPKEWEYRTKGQGVDSINGVWLNLLAASTPDWLIGSIPVTAIGGGFTSRVIFVVEENVRKKTAVPILGPKELALREDLKHDLEQIFLMKGEYKFSPQALKRYTDWYDNDNTKIEDSRFWGYAERKHIHMLKLAIIYAVCDSSPGIIEVRHIDLALKSLNEIEPGMVEAFGGAGRSQYAADISEIIQNIKRAGSIPSIQLRKSLLMDVDTASFFETIATLTALEMIKAEPDEGGEMWYSLTDDGKKVDVSDLG